MRARPSYAGLGAALLCALAPAAAAQLGAAQVFQSGLRWSLDASASEAWIPRGLAFGRAGEFLLAAPAGQHPHLRLISSAPLLGPASLALDEHYAGALGSVQLAAREDSPWCAALAQFPAPDSAHKRAQLVGYAPSAPGAQLPGSPVALAARWQFDIGAASAGQALLGGGRGSSAWVVAVQQAGNSELLVQWRAPVDGALIAQQSLPAAALKRMAVSADSARVALALGTQALVLQAGAGVLYSEPLAVSTEALALSEDGRTLALGAGASLRVLRESAGLFALAHTLDGAAPELASRVALSADGQTLALGWWNAQDGKSLRFEAWSLAAGAHKLHEIAVPPSSAALQDLPEAVAITRDGARMAYGAWGQGDANPELWWVERSGALLLSASLPGSVQALALDSAGTRLAVAYKHAHANQFASTGGLRLYDTGERDAQVLEPALIGGSLSLAAFEPGSLAAAWILGQPGAARVLPGIAGELWIDPSASWWLGSAGASSAGLYTTRWPLSNEAALVGLDAGLQAVHLLAGAQLAFGAALVRPCIL